MSRAYYYFAASLPTLEWKGKLPLTCEEFLLDCRRLLIESDYVVIEQLLNGDALDKTGNASADKWIQFNQNFRNEIAWVRAQNLNKDPLKYIKGMKEDEPQLRNVIQEAVKADNLIEAEMILDRMRWQFLDDLMSGHYYDMECLITYGLKLNILTRHQEYNSPKGRAVFDELRMTEIPEDCITQN